MFDVSNGTNKPPSDKCVLLFMRVTYSSMIMVNNYFWKPQIPIDVHNLFTVSGMHANPIDWYTMERFSII